MRETDVRGGRRKEGPVVDLDLVQLAKGRVTTEKKDQHFKKGEKRARRES